MSNTLDQSWCTLSQQQATDFERDGFLHVPNALEPEIVSALCTAGDRLIATDQQLCRRDIGNCDGFRNVIAFEPLVLDILLHAQTFPLVVQLMGPHLQLHTSDLIWKYPDPEIDPDEAPTLGWHRDIARMTRDLGHDRMPRVEIKVAYFLSDCPSAEFGQTHVAAGSHRWRETWQRTEDALNPPGDTALNLKAGDALLFENRTWHAAGLNSSSQIRKTLMMGYSHNWVRPDDYDQQDDSLLDRCNPIQRCLLEHKNPSFDELGRFRPCQVKSELEAWAEEHGYTKPACH